MKTYIIITLLAITQTAIAQHTTLNKYNTAPYGLEEVFLDAIEHNHCTTIGNGRSQYRGQVDKKGMFYGYGMFINGDGSEIIGKFRNGQPILSITIGTAVAIVGSPEHRCTYNLETGKLLSIDNEKIDNSLTNDYEFMSLMYENGDRYIGEIYKGERHGLGIYYYRNGDIWFGEYNHGTRIGYGALFRGDNEGMEIGQWQGEDTRRFIRVKETTSR